MFTLCLDFDGTVVTHDYPRTGKNIGAVKWLQTMALFDVKIILFTCRSGESLAEAENWFKENKIKLWASQHNPEQITWSSSPKPLADFYLDDRALGIPLNLDPSLSSRPFVDWARTMELLLDSPILEEISKGKDELFTERVDLFKLMVEALLTKNKNTGPKPKGPFKPLDTRNPINPLVPNKPIGVPWSPSDLPYPWIPTRTTLNTCSHDFGVMGLYIPAGQTMELPCKICGKWVKIRGNGPTC